MKGTLPPQAYTRDILAQAYLWIQKQPESIRAMANSPDSLVGLYLRARRNGGTSLESEAPVSSEDFRANLKNLAHELQQFSSEPEAEAPKEQPRDFQPPPQASFQASAPREYPREMPSDDALTTLKRAGLDSRTLETLARVKTLLNLSSETEALRMLVVLGYEKAQVLFKKETFQ